LRAGKPGNAIRSIINGTVVDPGGNTARKAAIIIDRGCIERVDPDNKRPLKKAVVHDARGSYIIPAFSDSHTHLLAHGIELQRVDLSSCASPGECLERLRARIDGASAEVFGVNWDESAWVAGSARDVTRYELDRLFRSVPVIMRRVCGHFAICNSRALEMIPGNWRIVDRKRGYLYEGASLYLNDIFKPSQGMFERGLELATEEALSRGVTSIHEIVRPECFRILQLLRPKLKIRIAVYLQERLDEAVKAGLSTGLGDDMLKFSGIKFYLDGSIGARTAAMGKPYRGTKSRGTLLMGMPQLVRIIKKAEAGNIQVILHAIGDRTARLIVTALASCGFRDNRLRHRVEHLEYVDQPTVGKLAGLGLLLSMQPNFVARWQGPGGMYEQRMGNRYRRMNAFATLAKAGLKLMFGSDSMPLDPLFGLSGAVDHPFEYGRLSPGRALYYYTTAGPYGTFDEAKKGRIAPGYFADLVLLDKNPLEKQSTGHMKVLAVFLAGKIVYSRAAAKGQRQ
jgi:predicted amidohydrolase YtcJ